jgi:hypothetical protein
MPRYGQLKISDNAKQNDFQQIISPNKDDGSIWIHQDAWFSLADFEKGISKEYKLKKEGNGVFVFVISGTVQIGNQTLEKRDGAGLTKLTSFNLEALEKSEVLIMEVPMQLPN